MVDIAFMELVLYVFSAAIVSLWLLVLYGEVLFSISSAGKHREEKMINKKW